MGFEVLYAVLDFFPEPVGSVQFFVAELEEAFVVLDGFNCFVCAGQVLFEALDVFFMYFSVMVSVVFAVLWYCKGSTYF